MRVGSTSGWTSVSMGFSFSCGLLSGAPYCWGSNTFGTLGIGSTSASVRTPTAVTLGGTFAEIDAGTFESLAVDSTGAVYGWGNNDFGQLGSEDFTDQHTPVLVPCSSGRHSITADDYHACGIVDGALYCWGENTGGTLGTGEGLTPMPVANAL